MGSQKEHGLHEKNVTVLLSCSVILNLLAVIERYILPHHMMNLSGILEFDLGKVSKM